MLEMIKKIQEAEDYASLGAASKEQITDAENELKLKFSEDYKEYLSSNILWKRVDRYLLQ